MPDESPNRAIMIVDDDPFVREILLELLRANGYRALTASNGREALLVLHSAKVDLLILDVVMPEMNGLQLLEAIRADERYRRTPVLLLSESADRDVIRRAAQLRNCEYLLKRHFRVSMLLERIRRHLEIPEDRSPPPPVPSCPNPHADAPRLSADETLARIHEHAKARTLPSVLAEVLRIAGSRSAERSDLVSVLMRDPVLSARVLEAANHAAAQAGRRPVLTLMDAVAAVGFSTIRNTAVTVGVYDAFTGDSADPYSIVRLWQHSFAVAALMDRIVPAEHRDAAGINHLVGLCHELGDILLRQLFPEQVRDVIARVDTTGQTYEAGMREMLGIPHARLVAEVLDRIDMPAPIIDPIREYQTAGPGANPASMCRTASALRLADMCAAGLHFAAATSARIGAITRRECREVLGDEAIRLCDVDDLRSEVLLLTHLLTGGRAVAMPNLMPPKSSARLWYARHAAYADLDPLHFALANSASAHLSANLPARPSDLDGFSGIVAVAPASAAGFRPADLQACMSMTDGSIPVLLLTDVPITDAVETEGMQVRRMPITLHDIAEALHGMVERAATCEGVHV